MDEQQYLQAWQATDKALTQVFALLWAYHELPKEQQQRRAAFAKQLRAECVELHCQRIALNIARQQRKAA